MSRIALVTTTINVPEVLKLYRKLDSDVTFFVAGDLKTPPEAEALCNATPDCHYFGPDKQRQFRSSELIGWNTDSRRNIAILEALRWGADYIISTDDDMMPMTPDWGHQFVDALELPYDGMMLGLPQQWFDVGKLTIPDTTQRGLPVQFLWFVAANSIVDAQIGLVQGVITGIPDTNATVAIERAPFVHTATDILRSGFVVHPQTYAVANSQWTAFRAEFAPAFMQHYATQQRNTDIFASMLLRRLLAERNLYTYFGPPMAFHARKPRPLIKDLKAEMWGLEHIEEWADYLYRAPIKGNSVLEDCQALIHGCGFLPIEFKECAYAFYADCESVL